MTTSAGPATPSSLSAYDADENATLQASAGPLLSTPPATGRPLTPSTTTPIATGLPDDPLTVAATATKRAADAYAAARCELMGTPSLADLAAKASAAALAASMANLRLQSEIKPSVSRLAPASLLRARALAQDAQGSQLMATTPYPAAAFPSTSLGAVSGPLASLQHLTPKQPGPVLCGGVGVPELELMPAGLAMERSAGVEVEVPDSDLMSQLEQEEALLEESVRRLAFGVGASPGPSATSARMAAVTLGDIAAASATQQQQQSPLTPTLAPARLLASIAGTSSGNSGGASAMELGAEGNGEAGGAGSQAEAERQQAGRNASTPAARAMGCGSSSCSPMELAAAAVATAHQNATHTASACAPSGSSAGADAAAAGAGNVALEEARRRRAAAGAGGVVAAASSVSSAMLITDRTPARMQRMMGIAMVPPVSMAPVPTPQPAARPVGGVGNASLLGGLGLGGGTGGVGSVLGLPRTPGTGLRTPARRVAVVSDEAQAQALDEWVRHNLLVPAPGTAAAASVTGVDNGDGMWMP